MTSTHGGRDTDPDALVRLGASAVPRGIQASAVPAVLKLLLNIVENLASHAALLHGDKPDWLLVRATLLDRALATRLHHSENPQRTREELATVTFRLGLKDEAISHMRLALTDALSATSVDATGTGTASEKLA
eukprot:SAG31_NODE_21256_length_552_cov_0.723077_1_plen_132_part_10